MKRNSDVLLGIFFVAFGLGVWLILVPIGVERSAFGELNEAGLVGPKLLPTVASLSIAFVGGMITLRALLVRDKQPIPGDSPPDNELEPEITVGRLAVTQFIAACFGYILVLYLLGYVIATALLLIALQWLFGERRRLMLALLPPALSLGLYAFFRYALLVRFPQGRLFVVIG